MYLCSSQPINSNVLTDKGFMPIDKISKGDLIVGINKSLQIVENVYSLGKSEKCVVIFSDGRKMECGYENHVPFILEDNNFVGNIGDINNALSKGKLFQSNYEIDINSDVPFIDPFLIGLILSKSQLLEGTVVVECDDEDMSYGFKIHQNISVFVKKHDNIQYISLYGDFYEGIPLCEMLKPYYDNFIDICIHWSIENRLRLLDGLLRGNNPSNDLDKKISLLKCTLGFAHEKVHIKEIIKTGELVDMKSIKVSSPNRIYYTDDFILTKGAFK